MPKTRRQLDDEIKQFLNAPKARSHATRAKSAPTKPQKDGTRYWIDVRGIFSDSDDPPVRDTLKEAQKYAKEWQARGFSTVISTLGGPTPNKMVERFDQEDAGPPEFYQPIAPKLRREIINQLDAAFRLDLIPLVDQSVRDPIAYYALQEYMNDKQASKRELLSRAKTRVEQLRTEGRIR